ncbi:MAG: transglutaminase family protein [Bacteroidales bacterium]|nr:transglutaminase family protein [Bacteroidales bacterium]
MTGHSHKELEALMRLLEDPDSQIFGTVADRLIELGEEVVLPLEKRWEATLKPDLQEKIENVIKQIQFNILARDMEAWKTSGGSDLLYGAYFVARFQYPDLGFDPINEMIEKIKRDIWLELNNELTALEKVKVINYFMYDIHKFAKSLKIAHTPQLYLINHVIDTHKGSPVLLGLIYAELARRLNLPIFGVNLPRNFVLCYYDQDFQDDPNGILFYINPSDNGEVLGLRELRHFLSQLKIEEKEFYYKPCSNVDIIERLVINLQYAYDRSGQPDKAAMLKQLFRSK